MTGSINIRVCPHGIDALYCGFCREQCEAAERAEAEAPGRHECAHCGAVFDGVPVRNEAEVWYTRRRSDALAYCSTRCLDLDHEAQGRRA